MTGPANIRVKRDRLKVETREEGEPPVVAEGRAGYARAIEIDDLARLGNLVEQVHGLHTQFQLLIHREENRPVELPRAFAVDRGEGENHIARRLQEIGPPIISQAE